MNKELSFSKKLATSRIVQQFRHRVYTPLIISFDRLSDIRRRVRTQALIDPSDLGFSSSQGNHYEATRYSTLKKILKFAKSKGYSTLLDIGCGYGRPLIVAKELGFSKLYGVDISQQLIDECSLNLKKLRIRANISCCDIENYLIPNQDLVILHFNALKEDRLTSLIEKLKNRQNKCLFIDYNPNFKNPFPFEPIYTYNNWHFGMYHEGAKFYEIN